MIEILVALVIGAFGLLALAGFVTKATAFTVDATQRARAGTLLNDMANRLAANKANAGSYVVAGAEYGEEVSNCSGITGVAALDLCEWNNLLAGANDGGGSAFLGYRGCIEQPMGDPNAYVITVAWGSLSSGIPPHLNVTCGKDAFGDESSRRIIRTQVRMPSLTGV